MPKSQFVSVTVYPGDTEGKEITPAQARFEDWVSEQGYVPAVDGSPYDSAEGGYLGTIDAGDLLADYLAEHPEQDRYCDELREHSWEMGELWNDERWNFRQGTSGDEGE
jgi:hypothetical protein